MVWCNAKSFEPAEVQHCKCNTQQGRQGWLQLLCCFLELKNMVIEKCTVFHKILSLFAWVRCCCPKSSGLIFVSPECHPQPHSSVWAAGDQSFKAVHHQHLCGPAETSPGPARPACAAQSQLLPTGLRSSKTKLYIQALTWAHLHLLEFGLLKKHILCFRCSLDLSWSNLSTLK